MEDRLEYPDLDDSATLAEIDAEIERLERELTDSRCAHETRLLTKRTFANGSVHFVLQCRRCGEQQGGPVRAKEAQAQLNGAEALPFDVDLQSTYGDWRGDMVQRLTELNCSRHALIDPEAAASSALVDEERDQQKARVAGIVASCRDELRAELGDDESVAGSLANAAIGLRRTLRDARIAAASRFTSEDELKLWLEAHLADDFDLVREVVGSHLAERTRVQIDYIAYPRPHLVAAGFADALRDRSKVPRSLQRLFEPCRSRALADSQLHGLRVRLGWAASAPQVRLAVQQSFLRTGAELAGEPRQYQRE